MTAAILDKIVAEKRREVEQMKKNLPAAALKERHARREAPRDFSSACGGSARLIAEVKKASPSRGILCPDFNPVEIARTYERGGAAAISVLTEAKHFQGSLDYLATIREEISIPLLRKDFIFDEYQVYESAAYGADALLLIAAILSREQLEQLLALSHSLGMACLVEAHNEYEVAKAVHSGAGIIGINNRDLNTFKVDINTTRRLRPLIPEGRIVVSESGINNRSDMEKLRNLGVNAVLVGEALVTAGDITAKMEELVS
jgi:indole-3-glycerol phosphate synthase